MTVDRGARKSGSLTEIVWVIRRDVARMEQFGKEND
jgi:hypothetical protein